MLPRVSRLVTLGMVSLLGSTAGCFGLRIYGPARPSVGGEARESNERATGRMLSAHLSTTGPASEIVVVFSEELDPTTVSASFFGVALSSGGRTGPDRAVLGPASEFDENRTVTLIGDFDGESGEDAPVAVHVIGPVYGEQGAAMEGTDAPVRGFDAPDEPVLAERIAVTERTCPGSAQVVRTYWTDILAGVEEEDLEHVVLVLADGSREPAVGFDDHRIVDLSPTKEVSDGGEAKAKAEAQGLAIPTRSEDNVLDLCLAAGLAVRRVEIADGIFTDAGGHPVAGTSLEVSP
jgi:hypothetical protein